MDQPHSTTESDYFIIPNPIYDVVFRYLMEDTESAIIVLSTLINEKITKLEFTPLTHAEKKKPSDPSNESNLETTEPILPEEQTEVKDLTLKDTKTEKDIRLFHLDFTATVELPDGS